MSKMKMKNNPYATFKKILVSNNKLLYLVIVILVAISLRIWYNMDYRKTILYNSYFLDARTNHQSALNYYNGLLHKGCYWKPPGYSKFLYFLYSLYKPSYDYVVLIQSFLGILNVALIFFITLSLTNNALASTIAALLYSLYPVFIYYENEILDTTLFIHCTLISLFALIDGVKRRNIYLLSIGGLFLGISSVVRATNTFFVVIAVWYLKKNNIKLKYCLLYFVLVCIPIFPVILHNYKYSNELLISSNGGINFYWGNLKQNHGQIAPPSNSNWETIKAIGKSKNSQEASKTFFNLAIKNIQNNPAEFLYLYFKKIVLAFVPREIANIKDIYLTQTYSTYNNIVLNKMIGSPAIFLLCLAIPGFFICYSKSNSILILYIFYNTLIIAMFFVNTRFRIPAYSLFPIFAGMYVVKLLSNKKKYIFYNFCVFLLLLLIQNKIFLYSLPPIKTDILFFETFIHKKQYQKAFIIGNEIINKYDYKEKNFLYNINILKKIINRRNLK